MREEPPTLTCQYETCQTRENYARAAYTHLGKAHDATFELTEIKLADNPLPWQKESIEDLTTEQFDSSFKTNVYALFWICKAALPHLPPGATIINTASIQAYQPSPTLLDYAPTKAAIVAFTKSLAKQVVSKGIRVNVVAPGPVWTPLQSSGGKQPEKIPDFGAKVPLGRPAQPAELAPIYVVLASQESSYVTDEVYGQ